MMKYSGQTRVLVAVDCIIFGFDGENFKLLLIQRGFAPEQQKWSLMGGFVQPEESLEVGAQRVLKQLTGLEGVYLEQIPAFSEPHRDPVERTISVPYFALVDIHQYEAQLSSDYQAEWFLLHEMPHLIFDHNRMVEVAKMRLRYKAALHPILFELLPEKFTLPKLQTLYEKLYETTFDKRNFSRKVLSTGLLVRQEDKDKESSRKGAFYFKLDKEKYYDNFEAFLKFIPNPEKFLI
ncbi:NUDIX domain-containing protein [Rufibacter glacialis]|uniref:NUDIX domain-containing protein n=1 Tax=Rufibacter glacialis TaxID=1259555 RepID=A0A5M8QRN0_9BACT|nr:NUDIX domain-containing protein [Rufibacter glacialis]KAA6437163.1 NUDIX hydrolase [Rufibacter glacialis]GGK61655.1 DNA mismatch repair protein MutT [Rufibacter glacialis]